MNTSWVLRSLFYDEATRPGVIVNPLENAVIVVSIVLGFFLAMLMRSFVVAIIIRPFFGLIRHARLEDGVGEVSAVLVMSQHKGHGMGRFERERMLSRRKHWRR